MDNQTREAILKNIERLKTKAFERFEHLEKCGALTSEISAGVVMADITSELAKGYSDIQKTEQFKELQRY